jgi:hypothetical protein
MNWQQRGNTVKFSVQQTPSNPTVPFWRIPIPVEFRNSEGKSERKVFYPDSLSKNYTFSLSFAADTAIFDPEVSVLAKFSIGGMNLDAVQQAIRDTFDPDSNGDVFASIDEFVEDLGRRFRESTEFEAGLAELTLRGFGALAEVIRTEGPKAADLLSSSLADPAAAAEAEALLTGQANTLGSGYGAGFALGIQSESAEVARALAATVESEAVRAGILAAASDLALLFAANFDPQILIDNFDISLPASVIQANVGPGADLVGGSSSTDFGAQGSARGFTVNIVNPTVTDLDTSVGQATSTLGAISGLVQ